MRKATNSDIRLVIEIITESFINNPSAVSVLKNKGKKRKKHLAGLAKYVFKTAQIRNGIYISDDESGVAVCYKYKFKKESLYDFWNQLIFAIKVVGLHRVIKVLKRESYIKKQRVHSGEFFYFWFFGVSKNGQGKGAASELWKAVLKEAEKESLPIYLETSVEKNKNVYQRFGFKTYHTWNNEKEKINLWFMKKDFLHSNQR